VHAPAALLYIPFEGFEKFVEVRERVIPDGAALFPQGFEVAVSPCGIGATTAKMGLQSSKRGPELRIVQRLVRRFNKSPRILHRGHLL
jgi:hypothetical protein